MQKYISQCGITSRRKAEDMIKNGLVSVNGQVVTALGSKIGPEDAVEVEGRPIDLAGNTKVYLLMNKPRGFVTTLSDPEGRKTVIDLIKGVKHRVLSGRATGLSFRGITDPHQ